MPTCVRVTSLMFCAQIVGKPSIIPDPIATPAAPAAPLSRHRRLTRIDGGSPARKVESNLSVTILPSLAGGRGPFQKNPRYARPPPPDLRLPRFVAAFFLGGGRRCQAGARRPIAGSQVEIIFFSTPTPAATA